MSADLYISDVDNDTHGSCVITEYVNGALSIWCESAAPRELSGQFILKPNAEGIAEVKNMISSLQVWIEQHQ